MKKITFIFILLGLFASQGFGQNYIDLSLAARDGFSSALSYQKQYGIGTNKKIKIGWGLRSTFYTSGPKELITAPAELTSGKQSIVAFFTAYKDEKLDTMSVNRTSMANLNALLNLEYAFTSKFGLGFNIDALGFTVGKAQKGLFHASQSEGYNQTEQNLKPTPFNVLLISDSDRGSLNSELYGRYAVNENWGLRLGISFQFIEYTADQKLTYGNDRYRLKTLLPHLAFFYQF
ncbi:hypothetical protein LAG90_13820 [Marinilongibacter aquaticus]|uniref:hypothetical protein n=1 Tax=Marinilongibacter aquaticus TaxID=2975157 RepID=UPI0021BD7A8A|nr:hypothetical protein [Marinilongibacter aquaticus]UBM57883.1 hypothetical protein LAG90_13820 [Marinilongibacter aquaticus]